MIEKQVKTPASSRNIPIPSLICRLRSIAARATSSGFGGLGGGGGGGVFLFLVLVAIGGMIL
jgi:hypothetical protein